MPANSRLSGVVSIFPVIGHAGVAENESDQFGEACFGANIVRQDHDATLTGLDADHGVGGLAVVAALVEAVALRAVEDDDAQARRTDPCAARSPAGRGGKGETDGQW